MMWNSVISTEGARYMCTDIKSFYLESPLERKEYMKMPLHPANEKLDAEGIIKHKNIIQQFTWIITNKPPQRVTTQSPQRVTPTSTSVDITAPRIIKKSKRIHQRKTRSNTPMPTIIEDEELILEEFEDTVMRKELEKEIQTIQKISPRKATPGPTLIPTDSRNTSAKHATRKTID